MAHRILLIPLRIDHSSFDIEEEDGDSRAFQLGYRRLYLSLLTYLSQAESCVCRAKKREWRGETCVLREQMREWSGQTRVSREETRVSAEETRVLREETRVLREETRVLRRETRV